MMPTQHDRGFSLVEVTLALGVIGFALVAVLGLVPIAQTSSRDAADDTKAAVIQQDVFARVRAQLSSTSSFTNAATTFPNPPTAPSYYYTNEGIFFSDRANLTAAVTAAKQNGQPLPNFAVAVTVGTSFANALPNVSATSLKPVIASLGYPIDEAGSVIGPTVSGVQANAARKTFTFYVRKP